MSARRRRRPWQELPLEARLSRNFRADCWECGTTEFGVGEEGGAALWAEHLQREGWAIVFGKGWVCGECRRRAS